VFLFSRAFVVCFQVLLSVNIQIFFACVQGVQELFCVYSRARVCVFEG